MKSIIGFGLVLFGVFLGAVLAFGVIYGYLTHSGAKSSYSAWCGLTQANVCDVYSDIDAVDAVASPMHVTTWGVMQPFGKSTEDSVTESYIAQPVTYNNGQVTANVMFMQGSYNE